MGTQSFPRSGVIADDVAAFLVGADGATPASVSNPVPVQIEAGGAVGQETTLTPAAVVLVASTAKDLLAASATRVRAYISNPLATPLYVRKATLAASAATTAAGGYDFIIPGGGGQFISDAYEYAGGYNGICATAGSVNVSNAV